jgi:carbon storage regulator
MLMLTRNINQSIIIQTSDGDIEIIITSINGNQVRLGIEAPESVDIWRSELIMEDTKKRPRGYTLGLNF